MNSEAEQMNLFDQPEQSPQEPPAPHTEPEQATETAVTYYEINETAARRAKDMNSFYEYKPGSATAEYRRSVDEAARLAKRQKSATDPIYHEKIDHLLDTYARKLAENMNHGFEIETRVPSVMIAGPANFPVRKKEKQNAARDKNMGEWQYVQGLLEKIRSTGTGGISADNPKAVTELENKLASREALQDFMKSVNTYYRKHGTLDGCPDLPTDQVEKTKAAMSRDWRQNPQPFASYQLSNNNAEIRRLKQRIADLQKMKETGFKGWEFEGGNVEANQDENRLQIFFDGKPGDDQRAALKGNGFRWAPSIGAWQRQLNHNAIRAADRLDFIKPSTGEKPSQLQPKAAPKKEEIQR